ncbi:MAG: phosphomannomutase/phosphoglucomutase [Herpetosiphon sp.]
MAIDPRIFKAYDIRGIYPTELDEESAVCIGRAFATFVRSDAVVVGRDMRTSGSQLFEAVTDGLRQQGTTVIDIGMVSTDQYYYACSQTQQPGIMVTASHNPKEYNGFKMVRKMPYLLSGSDGLQELLQIVQRGAYAQSTGRGEIRTLETMDEFVAAVLRLIDIRSLHPLKVVADTGNGMVGPALSRVYQHLPVELIGMYLNPDGTLPNHGLDPLQEENRRELQQRVVSEGADVGFAFDGDGDRFFVIDDRGHFIPGDYMTALLAQYLLKKHPGERIVYDVRASWAVPNLITESGGTPLIERVGHAFIKRRMADDDVLFAGEVTGHYYFRDFNYADSGIIPSLIILEMLSRTGKRMSELLQPLESKYFVSGEINSTVVDGERKMRRLEERFGDGTIETIDGLSVSYPTWHFNVRASNTEPLLRLNLESITSATDMAAKRDTVLALIRE